MKAPFKHIVRTPLVQNSVKLLSANVIAQAIGLVVYPILTRLYTPEDFGVLNLFLSIGSILILLANADYHCAIIIPKKEKDSIALVQLSFYLILIVTCFTALSTIFAPYIANFFHVCELTKWYSLLPIYVFSISLWNVLNYWFIRHNQFSRVSIYQLSQSGLGAALKIVLGYLNFAGGMVAAMVIAPILSLAANISIAWKKYMQPLAHFDTQSIRDVAQQYRQFPIFSMSSSLVNMLSSQLPVLVLTPFFCIREIGLWSMAILLSYAPLSMIAKTLSQTLYQYTMEHIHKQQSIRMIYRQFISKMLIAIIPSFSILWIFLPKLTGLLLGAEWTICGQYIRWLMPWLVCNVLVASIGFLAGIFAKQKIEFLFELLRLICRVTGLIIGIVTKNFSIAIIGYAVGSFIITFIQLLWLMTLVKTYDTSLQNHTIS